MNLSEELIFIHLYYVIIMTSAPRKSLCTSVKAVFCMLLGCSHKTNNITGTWSNLSSFIEAIEHYRSAIYNTTTAMSQNNSAWEAIYSVEEENQQNQQLGRAVSVLP